jgi:hypothetical protein
VYPGNLQPHAHRIGGVDPVAHVEFVAAELHRAPFADLQLFVFAAFWSAPTETF